MKFVHDYMQPSVRQIPTNTKQTPFEWHSSIKKTKTALTIKENSHLKKYVKEKANRKPIQKSTNTKITYNFHDIVIIPLVLPIF
ncbi:MAG: hypothetical protein GY755_23485 [Chloroflexi bacterium]|nr:hypothetical protein [Chloroflexota bacterium]